MGELLADLAVDLIPGRRGGRKGDGSEGTSHPQQVGHPGLPLFLDQDHPRRGGVGPGEDGRAGPWGRGSALGKSPPSLDLSFPLGEVELARAITPATHTHRPAVLPASIQGAWDQPSCPTVL